MENIVQGQWFRGPSADLGTPIDQSLRFRGGQVLARTFSGNSNRDQCTFSCWFKRSDVDGSDTLFGAATAANTFERVVVNASATISVYAQNGGTDYINVRTSAVYRDPSAWYHLVYVKDTTQSTASDRIKLYINGARITDFEATTYPGQNTTTGQINNNVQHTIGRDPDTGAVFHDGYIAEAYFLDGICIGETSGVIDEFGRYNEDGVWVPKAISFTSDQYGNNGFRLTFDSTQDSDKGVAIGIDSAPIGASGHTSANNFTESGFNSTAISSSNPANDVDFFDTPTSNYQTFNPLYPVNSNGPQRFSDANLSIDLSSASSLGYLRYFFSTLKMPSSGKWYFEHTRPSTVDSNEPYLAFPYVGFTTIQDTSTAESSNTWYNNLSMASGSGYGYRYGTTTFTAYGSTQGSQVWPIGAVIGCSYDADTGDVRFYNQGVDMGLFDTLPSNTDFYLSAIQNYTHGPAKFNFGQMPFVYTPPTGFKALHLNELEEPTIKDGKKYFGILLYNGNGSTQSISDTNSVDFTPDLVWVKARTPSGIGHFIADSVRGGNGRLDSSGTTEERTNEGNITFQNGGFNVTSTHPSVNGNASSNTYVAWCWKAGTSYTPTVTGFTSPSASINTEAGFGIYTFTGNNVASSSFTHGLDSTPELIIAKNRTTASDWAVFGPTGSSSTPTATDTYLRLNEATDANKGGTQILTGNTSTTVSVNSFGETAGSDDYVYYLWHSVEGFSKFGQYAGHSNSHLDINGAFVYCGFKPRWVMIKAITRAEPWMIFDSELNAHNPSNIHLRANETSTSSTYGEGIDIVSNGFKVRAGASIGEAANDFLYMAFAEHPFGGENQPPATAR